MYHNNNKNFNDHYDNERWFQKSYMEYQDECNHLQNFNLPSQSQKHQVHNYSEQFNHNYHQNHQQQNFNANQWINKRSHDYSSNLSSSGSPEPKRQTSKRQNSFDNLLQNSQKKHAIYQSQPQHAQQQQYHNFPDFSQQHNQNKFHQKKSIVQNPKYQQKPIDHNPQTKPTNQQQQQQQQHVNTFRNNFPYAAQILNQPNSSQNSQFSPFGKKKQDKIQRKAQHNVLLPPSQPIFKIVEERQREWNEKFSMSLNLLKGCQPGEEVKILLTNLQPLLHKWSKIKEDINSDLLKFFNSMNVEKILLFGSSITGLYFHGSDLDFYVELTTKPSNEEETKKVINQTAKLSRTLPNCDFAIICSIQNARVPLIRLLHRKTKINCDINFTSKFGYYNSYFIGHIINFDRRIKELAVILKLWSKAYKLASQMIITNYCLLMLLIFYLQNLKDPMIDTIIKNQKTGKPMILDDNKKWNFYFNDSIDLTKTNHQSLRELLTGFFEFYSNINPREQIVSLYTGSLINRKEFETAPQLVECRSLIDSCNLPKFRIDNADFFYVQDGFELNLNIGIKVKKHTELFFELIKMTRAKCQELSDKPFSEMLIKLFTDIKLPVPQNNSDTGKSKKEKGKGKKKFEMKIHAIPGDLKQCLDILTASNHSEKILTSEDQHNFFFNHAVEYTQKFLQEIYMCTVIPEIVEEKMYNKQFKLLLDFDTVNGRKKINFKDENTYNTEKNLSAKIAASKIQFDLNVNLIISSDDKGKSVKFEFIDNMKDGKSGLHNFGTYFSINIFTALRYYLKKRYESLFRN